MKTLKWLGIVGAVALVAFAIGTLTTAAFAQDNGPWGYGMRGGMMSGYTGQTGTYGPGMMGGYAPNATRPFTGTYGYGMMGPGGMMGNGAMAGMHQWMLSTGGMHTIVWNGLASALKLTPEELNAQLASGKTLAQIAEAQGVNQEQLAQALESAVKAGLDKAVADKVLTQEQADWMLSHMNGNWMISHMGAGGMGFGPGGCHGNLVPQKQS